MPVVITIIAYFLLLLCVSRFTGKGSNDAFFRGNRNSPWPLVAFGMVGASISGLTFIGVPGWVMGIDMTYMQMCMGFFVGYLIVAFVLLPLYYKYNLTSIYTYLDKRFGSTSYRTGTWLFIVSKLLGSAAKFYVVCEILQRCVASTVEVPYFVIVLLTLLLIWFYTRKSGIKALVWTDALQTLCLITALVLIMIRVIDMLDMDFCEAMTAVWNDSHSRIFEFDDFASKQNFWKQFLSGVFVVIVMTGLDQDMMQKNLTCKNLRSAQKDMCSYGALFAPVNFLFLALGVLLIMLYSKFGVELPSKGDSLLTDVVLNGTLGSTCLIFFTIGVIASAFSSADSAMTALTTTLCIDLHKENKRKKIHIIVLAAFIVVTLAFHYIGSTGVMDLIYTLVSYTYGPLLGLFAYGMFTKRKPCEKLVPWVAVGSPLICYLIEISVQYIAGYKCGYELLMINGMLTFVGLHIINTKQSNKVKTCVS